jgi:hypothetical protein
VLEHDRDDPWQEPCATQLGPAAIPIPAGGPIAVMVPAKQQVCDDAQPAAIPHVTPPSPVAPGETPPVPLLDRPPLDAPLPPRGVDPLSSKPALVDEPLLHPATQATPRVTARTIFAHRMRITRSSPARREPTARTVGPRVSAESPQPSHNTVVFHEVSARSLRLPSPSREVSAASARGGPSDPARPARGIRQSPRPR